MPDQIPPVLPPADPSATRSEGWPLKRIVTVATIGFIAIVAAPFLIGVLIAATTDAAGFGEVIRVLRDVAIIVLALVAIVIALAVAVLILQIAQLIGLIQTDVKPLLEEIRATVSATRGTVKFVGDTVAGPVLKVGGFVAGVTVFMREWGGIRRAIRHREPVQSPGEDKPA